MTKLEDCIIRIVTNLRFKQLATHVETFSITNKIDFADYISTAKRVETKKKRMQKIMPMILQGIGLNDKYKK